MQRSLSRLKFSTFAPSFRKSKATEYGRNSNSRRPKEWRSPTTLCGNRMHPTPGSMQERIMNALHLGKRDEASSLLAYLGQNKRTNDFVHVLEYCALSPDPLFVMEIWRTMEEKGIGMNNKCCLLMIQALCKGGYIDEAFNFMNFFRETPDLHPTLPMYNTLLEASAAIKSITHVNKCLDIMENDMVGKNETTYIELLKLAVLQKNILAVDSIWREYTKYYGQNIYSLGHFIWSFSKLGDLKTACEILQEQLALVSQLGFEENMSTSEMHIPIPLNDNLEFSRFGKVNITSSVYEENGKMNIQENNSVTGFEIGKDKSLEEVMYKRQNHQVIRVLRRSFTAIIHACVPAQNCRLAEELFYQMQILGVSPSRSTYNGFIRGLVSERGFHSGIEVLELMEQKNLKPYDATLEAISVSCSKGLQLDLAEVFLDQMSECSRPNPYNALLQACDTLDKPELAVRIFGKMKYLKINPSVRTYELLFILFGTVNAPYEHGNISSQVDAAKRITAIEKDMVRNNIQHSYTTIKGLLKALGSEGMIKDLFHYLNVAENRFDIYIGATIYNIVLRSLIEYKEIHMAINIFKTTMSHGHRRPDAVAYNVMIDCCSHTRCFKSACGLLAAMIRDGFLPQLQTYTTLIKIVVALEDFNEALIILNKALSEGIQPDVLLFNTILNAASGKNRIDVMEYIIEQMHREKVKPDPSTCAYVFYTYVKLGFFSTAMEALQVLSIQMISEEDIVENIELFENNFIYAEDSEAESRILDLFRKSKESLAAALLNLRWCAMLGNPILWSTGQSQWVKRLLVGG